MTTNEMAQKGFNTGFTDADGNELHVGDYVRLCGDIGEIVFSCGAFGIFIVDEVPWDALEELVRKDSGNRPSFLYNDNFISFWEIVWNLSEDSDEPCLPHVKSVTATGGIFTDEEGNKDVFMGCISSCFATLTQCEHTCGRYYTCDTVAMAYAARQCYPSQPSQSMRMQHHRKRRRFMGPPYTGFNDCRNRGQFGRDHPVYGPYV